MCFFWSFHALYGQGALVEAGTKYIIRSDVLYGVPNRGLSCNPRSHFFPSAIERLRIVRMGGCRRLAAHGCHYTQAVSCTCSPSCFPERSNARLTEDLECVLRDPRRLNTGAWAIGQHLLSLSVPHYIGSPYGDPNTA